MLYREVIAVCSEIHKRNINTLCGLNAELLIVKLVVRIVCNHWALVGELKLYMKSNSHRTVNTLRLGYKKRSVNAV
jgi:hypothetical protein